MQSIRLATKLFVSFLLLTLYQFIAIFQSKKKTKLEIDLVLVLMNTFSVRSKITRTVTVRFFYSAVLWLNNKHALSPKRLGYLYLGFTQALHMG
jgi:hypothetical protein